jgi:hypothetical protein
MKVLCLVIASDVLPEQIRFQSLWKKMMHKNLNVDCYLYKGHPDLQVPMFLQERTLWIKINESIDTLYPKTLRAFEYFEPQLDKYDYVFRSNLTTFVSFEHMLEFCKDLPRTNCCAGFQGGISREEEAAHGLEPGFSFPAGNGFLLSTDLVRRIVAEQPPLILQDDVSIGAALQKWKIPILPFARIDFRDHGHWELQNHQLLKPEEMSLEPKKMMFTYRLKSFDRMKDADMMETLIRKVYRV